jgi:hypothetical protein
MSQYIATATKNLLERRENQFQWRGVSFPGLVDVVTNALYDHPDDSFSKHVGMKTALEMGLIIPIHEELRVPTTRSEYIPSGTYVAPIIAVVDHGTRSAAIQVSV